MTVVIIFVDILPLAEWTGYMAVPFRRSKLLPAFLALNLFLSPLDIFWLVLDYTASAVA